MTHEPTIIVEYRHDEEAGWLSHSLTVQNIPNMSETQDEALKVAALRFSVTLDDIYTLDETDTPNDETGETA